MRVLFQNEIETVSGGRHHGHRHGLGHHGTPVTTPVTTPVATTPTGTALVPTTSTTPPAVATN